MQTCEHSTQHALPVQVGVPQSPHFTRNHPGYRRFSQVVHSARGPLQLGTPPLPPPRVAAAAPLPSCNLLGSGLKPYSSRQQPCPSPTVAALQSGGHPPGRSGSLATLRTLGLPQHRCQMNPAGPTAVGQGGLAPEGISLHKAQGARTQAGEPADTAFEVGGGVGCSRWGAGRPAGSVRTT